MSETTGLKAHRSTLFGLLLTALVLGLYGRILSHPFVIYDDFKYILRNPLVSAPDQVSLLDRLLTPQAGYIIPLTTNMEAALYATSSGAAWSFHGAGLFLHLLTCLLVYAMARRLSGRDAVAAALAMIFCAHPVVVEPVAWATGLKDMFMTPLALGAAFVFWLAHQEREIPCHHRLLFAVFLALMAMLSKPTAVLLGGAFALYLGARWMQGPPPHRRALVATGATLTLGAALGLMSRYQHNAILVDDPDRMAEGSWHVFMALGYQAHHVLWPDALHPIYLIDRTTGFSDLHTSLGLGVALALAGAGFALRKTSPSALFFAVAAMIYLPVSNILPFARFMADSYVYAPLAALCIAASVPVSGLLWPQEPSQTQSALNARRTIALVMVALIVPALAWRCSQQIDRWAGGAALWEPMIADYPDSPYPYTSLGHSHHTLGNQPALAVDAFKRSFKVGYDVDALPNYGVSLIRTQQLEQAECVLLEGYFQSPLKNTSLRNYAIFMASHPERPSGYPGAAAHVLPIAAKWVQERRMVLPQPLLQGFEGQVARIDEPAPAPPWPRRSCEATQ